MVLPIFEKPQIVINFINHLLKLRVFPSFPICQNLGFFFFLSTVVIHIEIWTHSHTCRNTNTDSSYFSHTPVQPGCWQQQKPLLIQFSSCIAPLSLMHLFLLPWSPLSLPCGCTFIFAGWLLANFYCHQCCSHEERTFWFCVFVLEGWISDYFFVALFKETGKIKCYFCLLWWLFL